MTDQEIDDMFLEHSKLVINGVFVSHPRVIARQFARAILSRAIPEGHVVVPGWLPIESVPEDGNFLVYMPEERRKYQTMYKHKQISIIGNAFSFDLSAPSHWMPLPAAPANKEG